MAPGSEAAKAAGSDFITSTTTTNINDDRMRRWDQPHPTEICAAQYQDKSLAPRGQMRAHVCSETPDPSSGAIPQSWKSAARSAHREIRARQHRRRRHRRRGDLSRYVDRPGFLEHSEAQDRSAGCSHEPVSPSMSATPLCNSLAVCARLGSGRAAEGRRLDAESRAEAPLRHLYDPTRREKLRSSAGTFVSKRPEVSESCALCSTS